MDTLESLDGYDHGYDYGEGGGGGGGGGRGHRRGRSGLKTYEQLRSLHPERGHQEESLEQ